MFEYELPPLSEAEKKLPIARYYTDYPLMKPGVLYQQLLSQGPMDPEKAIPVSKWLDWIDADRTPEIVYGYCMMPDGSGFYIEYSITPAVMAARPMRRWYGKWVNHKSPGMRKEDGSLRYKLWNQVDHWDHRFVNGKDDKDGIWSMETLDLGASGGGYKGVGAISHNIDVRDYGFDAGRMEELEKRGCRVSACYEEFEGPGHHLVLRFSRPYTAGRVENINCEWMGYWAKDGQVIRDEQTPVNEEYVRNVLIHNTVERFHLTQILPDLYEEYHGKDLLED